MKTLTGITPEVKVVLKAPLDSVSPSTVSTIADLRLIDKICTLIDSADSVLELEDADYEYLRKRVASFSNWQPAVRDRILPVADMLGI